MSVLTMESANVTADGTAFTGSGTLHAVAVGGAAGSFAIVYDNTAASGTVLMAVSAPGLALNGGVRFHTGLHVDLTTATGVTVYFTRSN